MDRDERRHLRAITAEVGGWIREARATQTLRHRVDRAATRAATALRRAVVEVDGDDDTAWRVLPLRRRDNRRLRALARRRQLPAVSTTDQGHLTYLTTDVAAAVRDLKAVTGLRRFFTRRRKRAAARNAAGFLTRYREAGRRGGVPDVAARLAPRRDTGPADDVLAAEVAQEFADLGQAPEVVPVAEVAGLSRAIPTVVASRTATVRLRDAVTAAGEAVRRDSVRRALAEMPIERLKDTTRDRLRTGPLTDAGIVTVQDVLDRGEQLEHLPGIAATTASRIRGAAETLWQATYDQTPVRLDVRNRTAEATELLRRLRVWDATHPTRVAADVTRAGELAGIAEVLDRPGTRRAVVFPGSRSVAEFREAVATVRRRARRIAAATDSADPWDDFLARPADYFALLAEFGFIGDQRSHGDLPDDIVEAVRQLELRTEHLSATLRGYQSFGARFALVQRKVVIGDEMGLGKTVEALAVLAHLHATGASHFLVACPAAVVTNWVREVAAKSSLRVHRVHGRGRETAFHAWIDGGGVAVTTFETLAWFEDTMVALPVVPTIDAVVVDEAHYIKNPGAKRTQRAVRAIAAADRAVLLTGTPLENRTTEFRNLVGYLRPDLTVDTDDLTPQRFRSQVAPAYLRRNQEDVLTELPELVEVEEWLPMSPTDFAAYRDSVTAANFMAMRQAAMLQGQRSTKVQRLAEIVAEAEANGRRVIVFSYFRTVLDHVVRALPGEVFGPLTGSVPAADRQDLVDRFTAAGPGAVLVAQIVAGGVGLNIQAASVVVICEPQLKPTTEWQAIARARRMGQLESVQVHRLLSEEGVDERVTSILARKSGLFAEYARVSDTAGIAPEALDISEVDLARDVVAAERERLLTPATTARR